MSKKDYRVFYDNYMNTNAATEVTGLIQSGEYNRDEWDSYREIFDFEPIPHRGLAPSDSKGTEMAYSDSKIDKNAPCKEKK